MKGDWLEASAYYLLKKHYRKRDEELYRQYRLQYLHKIGNIAYEWEYEPFSLAPEEVGVRFFYAVEGAIDPVSIYINDVEVVSGLPPYAMTNYLTIPAGDNFVVLETERGSRYSKLLSIHQDQLCTLAISAREEDMRWRTLLFRDDWQEKGAGPWIRFLHLSPETSPLEWVDAQGEIILEDVSYSNASNYQLLSLSDGCMIRIAGSHQVLDTLSPFQLHPNNVVTVIALGREATNSFRLIAVLDR